MDQEPARSIDGKPARSKERIYVRVSVLLAGDLTLPEHVFCADQHDKTVRTTVPSLSFLVRHPSGCRLIFDLGIRRDLSQYPAALHGRLESRQPIAGAPDVSASLRAGGVAPDDIDVVVLSHVHYDHACFIVGPSSIGLLQSEGFPDFPGHFERDLLPLDRTIELAGPGVDGHASRAVRTEDKRKISLLRDKLRRQKTTTTTSDCAEGDSDSLFVWQSLGPFDAAVDLFNDGSVYLVNSPGHLDGHINLLCRTRPADRDRESLRVYLAGDACHHERILKGETEIATWQDQNGVDCCMHQDKALAEDTLHRIRRLKEDGLALEHGCPWEVQVVLAHDVAWTNKNKDAVFPGCIRSVK
ncbi:hypothetical protein LTR47_009903 [Exophiala xenobiotica]|nr:hypothetical protein LTR47_009903 [Exophiala xenobiotica]KAK5243928.1 hypothetical protein LTS06_010404 [Exophiala xenobiotica]KAK5282188.1 hypothetical protein LTR40_003670 [Exophiala xenobiotica]KAK5347941.1 hypothetical protein LTR61_008193 [Exophiala xenobiotica]KAK5361450.1 hypothetical protein LTS03_010403 [Exophiala xenobiotica]